MVAISQKTRHFNELTLFGTGFAVKVLIKGEKG